MSYHSEHYFIINTCLPIENSFEDMLSKKIKLFS